MFRKFSEHSELYAFKRILTLFHGWKFNRTEPIPVAAIVYNGGGRFIEEAINEKTLGKDSNKSGEHAERLVIEKIDFSKLEGESIKIVISIPPCKECYKAIANKTNIDEILYVSSKGLKHKVNRWNKFIKEGGREIKHRQLDLESKKMKIEVSGGAGKRYMDVIDMWVEKTWDNNN